MHTWQQYKGIYLHIPFCIQKCLYCDFTSYSIQSCQAQQAYVEALVQEIKLRRTELPLAEAATIYVGGGTPTTLPLELLTRLVETLRAEHYWQEPAEATIEANPGTVNLEQLQALRRLGFDRISFGVQALQDNELRAMGRVHTAQEALEALRLARRAGFKRLSADLIYGYPTQTVSSVRESAERLLDQGLEHISVYGLTVEEGTPLARLVAKGELELPSEEATGDMYDFCMDFLPRQGLQRYEISNFAVPGQESLHNCVYWHYLPYLGLGAGATGFNGSARRTNATSLQGYQQGEAPVVEELTQQEQMAEYMFMGLRLQEGVDLIEGNKRFGVALETIYRLAIEQAVQEQLAVYAQQEGRLRLTEQGMRYGNKVFALFL